MIFEHLSRALCSRIMICLTGATLTAPLSAQLTTPTVLSANPSTVPAGSPGVSLTVTGSNFQIGAYVSWNRLALPTTYLSTSQLTASVPASLLTVPASVSVAVSNPNGAQSNVLLFQVTASELTIATTTVPSGVVGDPYSFTLSATGGIPPHSWTATTALPAGLSLSPSGMITGTPTVAGTFNFTVQVRDITNQATSKSFAITIAGPAISITNTQLAGGTVGQSYNEALTVTGGTAPYRWTVSQSFPPGLTLNQTSGAITGTPTNAGTFNFTAQVTDANQASANRSFSVTIRPVALSITTVSPLFGGTVGVAYAQSFSAAGGVPPYRWAVVSGDTGGLTLDPVSGALQGTPRTAGTFSFTVRVTDTAGSNVSGSFSVLVSPPTLTILTGPALPGGGAGANYTQSFSVVGGTAPYTWSLVSGGVPGLSFDSANAVLSGVPTAAGTFTFSLQARDAAGASATRTFTVVITAAALRITTETQLPNATLADPFSHSFTVVGGIPPYIWSVNGLPDGLTMDAATGAINGTPAAAGVYLFTVRVTDSARATSVDLFRIAVNLPPTPSAMISGLPQRAQPTEQLSLRVSLDSAFPAPISGQAILTFAPSTGAGDGTIQFSAGGRTADFTVPAGSRDAVSVIPLAIQTGTVAGTVTVSVRLHAGGIDITPTPAPAVSVLIDRAAPVIQSARAIRTSNGLSVEITGFSTAREVTQASFTFTAAGGQSLQNSTVTVPVEDLFGRWFQDPSAGQFGSQFVFTQTFTIQGDANLVMPEALTLTNRLGSATASIQR